MLLLFCAQADRYEPDAYTKELMLPLPTEAEVGITGYLHSGPGFTGIFKQRFSDFIVHEIDESGALCRLTDAPGFATRPERPPAPAQRTETDSTLPSAEADEAAIREGLKTLTDEGVLNEATAADVQAFMLQLLADEYAARNAALQRQQTPKAASDTTDGDSSMAVDHDSSVTGSEQTGETSASTPRAAKRKLSDTAADTGDDDAQQQQQQQSADDGTATKKAKVEAEPPQAAGTDQQTSEASSAKAASTDGSQGKAPNAAKPSDANQPLRDPQGRRVYILPDDPATDKVQRRQLHNAFRTHLSAFIDTATYSQCFIKRKSEAQRAAEKQAKALPVSVMA